MLLTKAPSLDNTLNNKNDQITPTTLSTTGFVYEEYLSSLVHTTLVHALKLDTQTGLLDLADLGLLRILKVTSVTKFHQVTRLVHFTLEATKGALNRLAITNIHLDIDGKGSRDGRSLYCETENERKERVRRSILSVMQ